MLTILITSLMLSMPTDTVPNDRKFLDRYNKHPTTTKPKTHAKGKRGTKE